MLVLYLCYNYVSAIFYVIIMLVLYLCYNYVSAIFIIIVIVLY